ncbi:DEKNAAC102140 [Brettanomyces naardenensis]|uniref:DEKNAAC102140 n=1 Tax=Brettanomyces naardenensis TaxID=13370 RepID=A0A448YK19_BRENA|nr:DEKNAAC102140 [Brettanomyces naardenensis]
MSHLEREMRSRPKRNHHAGSSRANSQTTTPDESFDNDVDEFSFPTVDELDLKDAGIQQQLQQDLHDVKILRSANFGALSREESRNNSIIGTIIDDELNETSPARSDSRSDSITTASGVRIYDVQDMIEALNKPRNKINTDSRLFLLGQAYKMVIHRPQSANVNERDMDESIDFIKAARSDFETVLSIKFATAYACTDSDEVGTQVMDDLIPLLFGKIFDFNNSNLVRASAIVAYFSLILLIFDGSDCYSLGDNVNEFLELIEGYQTDVQPPEEKSEDSEHRWDIITSSINGIGIVLSLLYKGGKSDVNELIQESVPRLFPFLGDEFPSKVHKAVCILIGLMYEIFDYSQEDDEDEEGADAGPYYNVDELKESISGLARESTKRVGKKNKKEVRSIYKQVLKTIDRSQRKASGEAGEEETEEDDEDIRVISRFSLTKTKQLPVKSWFAFVRLIQLKYIFDTELNSHYLSSREVRGLLCGPDEDGHYEGDGDGSEAGKQHWKSREDKESEIKKEKRIHKARDRKLMDEMQDLNLS